MGNDYVNNCFIKDYNKWMECKIPRTTKKCRVKLILNMILVLTLSILKELIGRKG
jgi:hypothetical protein